MQTCQLIQRVLDPMDLTTDNKHTVNGRLSNNGNIGVPGGQQNNRYEVTLLGMPKDAVFIYGQTGQVDCW